MLSDTVVLIFGWAVYAVLSQIINVFGISSNIINIICFVKQGFKDPVNVSLLGLAISDIGCLTTLVVTNICCTPAFNAADLPFAPIEVQYLTGAIPHTAFARVTAWLTALITLERCLCIATPLKVRQMFTQKRMCLIIATIFIVLFSSMAPVYVVNRLEMKFYPEQNKTLLGLVFREDREFVESISFVINNAFVPFTAFLVIIICTITLAVKLKETTKWRIKSTTTLQADNISFRNQKVTKMVVMVSTLFIACFIPISIIFIAMASFPGLTLDGTHSNMLVILGGLAVVPVSINSSANIIIYLRMSSNYRSAFKQLFCSGSKSPKHVKDH